MDARQNTLEETVRVDDGGNSALHGEKEYKTNVHSSLKREGSEKKDPSLEHRYHTNGLWSEQTKPLVLNTFLIADDGPLYLNEKDKGPKVDRL